MCDLPCVYDPPPQSDGPGRPLSILLLYCWQREYDKRPYRDFQFRRLDFEERMKRRYQCLRDFRMVVKFLLQRHLQSVSISSIVVSNADTRLLQDFVCSLTRVPKIELKLMRLPLEFFVMLRLNADKMTVTELSLKGTPLSTKKANMLREFLLANKTLRTLNVSNCTLTQYNFATVADGVYKSSSIRNFYANRILGLKLSLDTEKIASVVGSLLMQNKLVELTMQYCEFTAQDMEVIAEYLYSTSCTLRNLNLAYNLISADGTMFLMRAIASGKKLELLNISGNSIGSHGGEWIAMHLNSCCRLQHLYINDNNIGAEAINLILLTLKKLCRIKQLNLFGNEFDARSAMIVRRLLDSEVVKQNELDISYTFDENLNDYRIVPWQ